MPTVHVDEKIKLGGNASDMKIKLGGNASDMKIKLGEKTRAKYKR